MGEHGITARRLVRQIEPAGKLMTGGTGEVEGLRLHGSPPQAGGDIAQPTTASASISTS